MVQFDEKVYGPAKEKIESIFDTGTFVELCAYTKRLGSQKDFEGVVCGYGSVNGKLAFSFVQDSGRTKGAFGERHAKKIADTYALAIKNGAPMNAVRIPMGISVSSRLREMLSTVSKNDAPKRIDAGKRYL